MILDSSSFINTSADNGSNNNLPVELLQIISSSEGKRVTINSNVSRELYDKFLSWKRACQIYSSHVVTLGRFNLEE